MKCDILRTKTHITKPFLTFDPKKKSMLKLGIPDMIPEKKLFLVIVPLMPVYIEVKKKESLTIVYVNPWSYDFGVNISFMLGVGMFDTTTVFLFGFF